MLRATFLKLTAAAILSTAITPLALAQSAAPSIDAPVTITFYNYNLASAGTGADGTKKMIAEFEALHPDIKINAVGVTDVAGRIQADRAIGQGPDIAQVVFDDLAFTADNLGAHALEDTVPAEEIAAHTAGMVPNGLKLGVIGDKTWALAYTFSTPVLFYNADMFKAAGLDPATPPRNWAEVKQAAIAITEKTGKRGFGSLMFGGGDDDWMVQSVLLSNGGRTMSEDRTTLTFAEPAAVEAVKVMRDLNDAGQYENDSYPTLIEQMATQNLGMLLTTSALQGALVAGATGNYELVNTTMPGFGDKLAVPTNSGSGLVILTDDPVKQRAVWEFMKFLTSDRGYTIITSEIGYVPLRKNIVTDPQYLGEWVKTHPLVQANIDQLDRLQPWTPYPGPNYRQINGLMMDALELAIFGDVDVESTLKAAQEQAQSLMPSSL